MPAPIEGRWIAARVEVLQRCGVQPGDACAVLAELRSRPVLPRDDDDEGQARHAMRRLKVARRMQVTAAAGSDLSIDLVDARIGGVRGFTHLPLRGGTVGLDGQAVVRAGVLA